MKAVCLAVLAISLPGVFSEATPVSKVVQLLTNLEAKITVEGENAKKEFEEFAAWCEDRSKKLAFDIKTGKDTAAELKAKIDQNTATIDALTTKLDELTANLATDEADLKAATHMRATENADFVAADAELSTTIDTLERAKTILQRQMQAGGASMMQLKNAGSLVQALSVLVEASAISSADSARLTALVQSSQESDDQDVGAPDAAVYQSHSADIIGTLQSLLEKAQAQLSAARQKEGTNLRNFQLLKQSIEDEIKFGNKDIVAAKKGIAAAAETKSAAEGDLAVTSKDLGGDVAALDDTRRDCTLRAQEYEAATKSRAEELNALAEAKKVIQETTGGAESITYTQVSLLQLTSRLASGQDLANFEAVRFVRDLARKNNSPILSQLASRMASVVQISSVSGSGDPFAKVKGLISDMIQRLEGEADADATHKAFCDKHLAETYEKKADKDAEIAKLTTQIDQMMARSAQLKEEVAALLKALADLHASQQEMDKMRQAEQATFVHDKAEMEEGLEGIKMALKILREYYAQDKAHAAAEGAAGGIIGLLEVVESDFTKGLAEMIATEQSAQAAYEDQTKKNEIEKTLKQQDVKYKTKESTGLDKAVAEATSDRSGVQAELDAVLEYLATLKEQCIETAETYEERTRRRAAEIAGLKEALEILEGETVLIQQTRQSKTLRGAH